MKHQGLWFLIPGFLLVLAVMPLPYGYYSFLRIVVTASAVAAAVIAFRREGRVGAVTFAAALVATIFNPIIPVHLTRELWLPIDLVVAGFFVLLAWRESRFVAVKRLSNGEN